MTQTARLVSGELVIVPGFHLLVSIPSLAANIVVSVCLWSGSLLADWQALRRLFCDSLRLNSCRGLIYCSHAMLTIDALSCRAESLFAAYYFFVRKGYEVTITSIKGGKLPIDPRSVVTPYLTTTVKKGLTDGTLLVFQPVIIQAQFVSQTSLHIRHYSAASTIQLTAGSPSYSSLGSAHSAPNSHQHRLESFIVSCAHRASVLKRLA